MKKIILLLTCMVSLTVFAGTSKQEILKQRITKLEQDSANLTLRIQDLEKRIRSCECISEFFSDTTVAIFKNDSIKKMENRMSMKQSVQLSIIKKIDLAKSTLDIINLSIQQKKEELAEKKWSDEELKMSIALEIKKDINKLAEQLEEVDKLDISFMSKQQKQYVKQLFREYDKIYNEYF